MRAFAHRSWCAEVGGRPSNERLEFLGDAVLGWVVADLAYGRHTDLTEGKLTDLRKSVVNASTLAEIGAEIGLLGRSVSVALWAADPDTSARLEAALPELAPALATLGLEPGAVRVRNLPPEAPKPATGQYLDSRR